MHSIHSLPHTLHSTLTLKLVGKHSPVPEINLQKKQAAENQEEIGIVLFSLYFTNQAIP